MEVIFMLLSGVILVAGVLYWFWSHLQLTQKKVQLLENAVFELRTMLLSSERGPPAPAPVSPSRPSSGGAPSMSAAGYEDLGDDDWTEEEGSGSGSVVAEDKIVDRPDAVPVVAPTTVIREVYEEQAEESAANLMPGGRILPPTDSEVAALSAAASTLLSAPAPESEDQFRELFVAKAPVTDVPVAESLESMPVKELRRLAQERGIAGAADMRKKEILAALRQQVSVPTPSTNATLDLTKMGAVEEAEAEEEGELVVEDATVDEIPAAE
jgi:hypothetical protein